MKTAIPQVQKHAGRFTVYFCHVCFVQFMSVFMSSLSSFFPLFCDPLVFVSDSELNKFVQKTQIKSNTRKQQCHILTQHNLVSKKIMAVFILETDYPSGRTWASLFSASDDSSQYKYGHEDELSVQTNNLYYKNSQSVLTKYRFHEKKHFTHAIGYLFNKTRKPPFVFLNILIWAACGSLNVGLSGLFLYSISCEHLHFGFTHED